MSVRRKICRVKKICFRSSKQHRNPQLLPYSFISRSCSWLKVARWVSFAGKFGSGVLSYFKFLRWLYLLDMVISIFVLAFIVTPQLMYSPSYKRNNASFTGMEFLTGKVAFCSSHAFSDKQIDIVRYNRKPFPPSEGRMYTS